MKYLEAHLLICNIMTSNLSEPVTAVIVMERTSGLSIRNEWSSVKLFNIAK